MTVMPAFSAPSTGTVRHVVVKYADAVEGQDTLKILPTMSRSARPRKDDRIPHPERHP
jgi:hypothetical protein